MVNYSKRLDSAFSVLADATRRGILARLALGEATVSELASPFPVSLPAISRHLRVLEDAGFVRTRREGRNHWCALDPAPIREASGWLEKYRAFWEMRLDALARYLESEGSDASPARKSGRPKKRRNP